MNIIENDNCIFIDCDDTLVMWDNKLKLQDEAGDYTNTVTVPNPLYTLSMYGMNSYPYYQLVPHEKHIQYLKDSKIKNKNTIVVWSAGGWEWAKAVVEALELTEYVDAVMAKPTSYIDDLACKEFMGTRIYKEFKL